MAAVRAKPDRVNQTEGKVFTMPLAEALGLLLAARHVLPTDAWFINVDGAGAEAKLRIERVRQTVTLTPDETD